MTQDEIKKLFRYEDGKLYWLEKGNGRKKDLSVGSKNDRGYIRVEFNHKAFAVHRLIWTLFNGEIPEKMEIDHINRITDDNRIENLRCVSHKINMRNLNLRKNNKSGMPGIRFDARQKNKPWCVDIGNKFVGSFASKYLALQARFMAEVRHGYN